MRRLVTAAIAVALLVGIGTPAAAAEARAQQVTHQVTVSGCSVTSAVTSHSAAATQVNWNFYTEGEPVTDSATFTARFQTLSSTQSLDPGNWVVEAIVFFRGGPIYQDLEAVTSSC